MAAQKGRAFRIMLGDATSPTVYTAIAGAREDGLTLDNGEIDTTNKDSSGFRELIAGGNQALSLSVSGVVLDNVLFNEADSAAIGSYRLEFDDGSVITGLFQIRNYERTGSHEGELTFSATLESSGQWTATMS